MNLALALSIVNASKDFKLKITAAQNTAHVLPFPKEILVDFSPVKTAATQGIKICTVVILFLKQNCQDRIVSGHFSLVLHFGLVQNYLLLYQSFV